MFKNYLITAFRNLSRNKLYSFINITGLSLGLALFVAAQLISNYESTYDSFFPNADRIYAIYGIFQPDAGVGVRSNLGIQTRVGPLVKSDIPEAEKVARIITREYLARYEDMKFYQSIRFADPEALEIFTFDFVQGSAETALTDPDSLVITESIAKKYFGDENPLGKVIRFKNMHDLHVTAVIRDLPKNSHMSSSIIVDLPFQMLSTTSALTRLSDFEMDGDWYNMSTTDITYVLLREDASESGFNTKLDNLYEQHVPEMNRDFLASFELRNVTKLNLFPWEATGLPVMTSITVLGALILLIAIFNYTNLSTAQLLGRTREVGLRRVMGASKSQMFVQFLTESIALAALALILALIVLVVALPFLNDVSGKDISLNLITEPVRLAWLLGLVVMTGLLAGSYPAWLISRGNTIKLLNGSFTQGKRGSLVRSSMLVAQFSIAFFMIITVAIIYVQNGVIEKSSRVFNREHVITISRMNRDEIKAKIDTLRIELERLPGVSSFTVSNQVPFEQSQSQGKFGHNPGSEADSFEMYRISIDKGFLQTYDIPLIAGRNFSDEYTEDILLVDEERNPIQDSANVIVNELALEKLGFDASDALGRSFYRFVVDGPIVEYRIVGIIPDSNFLGFHNELKPIVFANRPDNQRIASVKISGTDITGTLSAIDGVWDTHISEFPIERKFLDDHFNDVYKIFRNINISLAGFAGMAVVLASIGLFGMAAYMAERRTREIGIRKVLGAEIQDILRLLLIQFSRPVIIALVIASPIAWFSAGMYLNFFAERAALSPQLFIYSGLAVLLLSWLTVATHALRVARSNPVLALRYE